MMMPLNELTQRAFWRSFISLRGKQPGGELSCYFSTCNSGEVYSFTRGVRNHWNKVPLQRLGLDNRRVQSLLHFRVSVRNSSSGFETRMERHYVKRPRTDHSQLKLPGVFDSHLQSSMISRNCSVKVSATQDASKSLRMNHSLKKKAPLADRVRPTDLGDFYGHKDTLGKESILSKMLEAEKVPNLILWGPPGTGKTTLARIIANKAGITMFELSAATKTLNDLRAAEKNAIEQYELTGKQCIVFVDEIHRFTKAQQDHLLEPVEKGQFLLICATTENPSFRLNNALISRCQVIVLNLLSQEDIKVILRRAVSLEFPEVEADNEALDIIASMGNGDARSSLNILESALLTCSGRLTPDNVKQSFQKSLLYYDRNCEEHYNLISAFHKSMRGGDVDASLYYLWRILEGGEDIIYLCRRLVRFASEDVGIADSNALNVAVSTYQACNLVGMPECGVNLSHCTIYMALAPKSIKVYKAEGLVKRFIKSNPPYPVPMHLRNAPTKLMDDLGYNEGYLYPPSYPEGLPNSYLYLPKEMSSKRFFGVYEEVVAAGGDQLDDKKCQALPYEEACVVKKTVV